MHLIHVKQLTWEHKQYCCSSCWPCHRLLEPSLESYLQKKAKGGNQELMRKWLRSALALVRPVGVGPQECPLGACAYLHKLVGPKGQGCACFISKRVQWSRPREHVLCGQTHEWMNGVRDGCRQFIWEEVIMGSRSVQMK